MDTKLEKSDRDYLLDALTGCRGPEQKRIAETGIAWIALLLRKNRDYGCSVWQVPTLAPECNPDAAIRVRMSDKITRLQTLLSVTGGPEVDESIGDTIRDLGAYCLLWQAMPKDEVLLAQ